jgi:hypothetical protein
MKPGTHSGCTHGILKSMVEIQKRVLLNDIFDKEQGYGQVKDYKAR